MKTAKFLRAMLILAVLWGYCSNLFAQKKDPLRMNLEKFLYYNSNSKVAGYSIVHSYKYLAGVANYSIGCEDFPKPIVLTWGLGARKHFLLADNFLFQGSIYPYIGANIYKKHYSFIDDLGQLNVDSKTKCKFAYGAAANVSAGYKVYGKTEKDNSIFLTVGYHLDAYEFKTKDLFKNGSISLGLTFIPNL